MNKVRNAYSPYRKPKDERVSFKTVIVGILVFLLVWVLLPYLFGAF